MSKVSRRIVLGFVLCLATSGILAAAPNTGFAIIPRPTKLVAVKGAFYLTPETVIIAYGGADAKAKQLRDWLAPATGFKLPVQSKGKANAIILTRDRSQKALGKEGYQLKVNSKGITITAATEAGLFYGGQTLRQLLPVAIYANTKQSAITWVVPGCHIEDTPRFVWRGLHLDVGRYFMSKAFVLKYIDLLAIHKMNIFHWHLTEDQGWRIEIKKYPKLTEVGAWRSGTVVGHKNIKPNHFDKIPHGGFYTQDEIKEVVAYAAARHVTVIPEIDMPGHAQAAIAAYPALGNLDEKLEVCQIWGPNRNIMNADESTILFMQDVLQEVIDLFPSKYIHVGGDEALKDQWEASDKVAARMKTLGLKDVHEMQSYFIKRMDTFLNKQGRRLVGWDEILEGGLAQNAVVMSWRGDAGGIAAAKMRHDVVMAHNEYTYFDHYQGPKNEIESEPLAIGGWTPLAQVYGYEPVPAELSDEEAKHILGAQGQLWSEYLSTERHCEYMAYPRACALAEVVWSEKTGKDFDQFKGQLKIHLKRLDYLKVNYRKLDAAPVK